MQNTLRLMEQEEGGSNAIADMKNKMLNGARKGAREGRGSEPGAAQHVQEELELSQEKKSLQQK